MISFLCVSLKIAKMLPGRTDHAIKNRYHVLARAKAKNKLQHPLIFYDNNFVDEDIFHLSLHVNDSELVSEMANYCTKFGEKYGKECVPSYTKEIDTLNMGENTSRALSVDSRLYAMQHAPLVMYPVHMQSPPTTADGRTSTGFYGVQQAPQSSWSYAMPPHTQYQPVLYAMPVAHQGAGLAVPVPMNVPYALPNPQYVHNQYGYHEHNDSVDTSSTGSAGPMEFQGLDFDLATFLNEDLDDTDAALDDDFLDGLLLSSSPIFGEEAHPKLENSGERKVTSKFCSAVPMCFNWSSQPAPVPKASVSEVGGSKSFSGGRTLRKGGLEAVADLQRPAKIAKKSKMN